MHPSLILDSPLPVCILPLAHPARGYTDAANTNVRRTFAESVPPVASMIDHGVLSVRWRQAECKDDAADWLALAELLTTMCEAHLHADHLDEASDYVALQRVAVERAYMAAGWCDEVAA